MTRVIIKLVRPVKPPVVSTPGSAGIDFFMPEGKSYTIHPQGALLIPSGVVAEFPPGYMLVAFNKSSIAKRGMVVGAQVVDQDYQGEIHLHLINASPESVTLHPGEKVMQLVLVPFASAEITEGEPHKTPTVRGTGGFGSTSEEPNATT